MTEEEIEVLTRSIITRMQKSRNTVQEIDVALEKLARETQEIAEELRQIQRHQEFLIQYEESSKRQAQLPQMSTNPEVTAELGQEKELDRAAKQEVTNSIRLRTKIIDQQKRTYVELDELQKRILYAELFRWKRGQQFAENGVPFDNNLEEIQKWCESLADIIWQNLQQIRQVETLCAQVHLAVPPQTLSQLHTLHSQFTSLLSSTVTSTFVIEQQPPQVMTTNTMFTATVRLLLGTTLCVVKTPPQVKVTIISEVQAKALLKDNFVEPGEASGDILNNLATMQYDEATRKLSASFPNLQLIKIKRAEKKGTESVTDEKFSLLFQSQFKVGGISLFHVWTFSSPVVVIDHGNEEPHAWATVTWDNAFAVPGRLSFQVPDKVPWKEMAQVLSAKFKAATGRELPPQDLQFLACKVFGSAEIHDNSLCFTWSLFCKEPLPGRNFTFWEWFYAILETTRDHLRNLWNDGLILGFVARQQAEDMLLKRCNGTFLLRFSDSVLGGVSVAFVTDSQQSEGLKVVMVHPFTSGDFARRSMADRLNDLKGLLFLFPDVPKDQAFGKYYTPCRENGHSCSTGYVKPLIITELPGFDSESDSCPDTPQSVLQSSDSGDHDPQNSADM